MFSRGSAHELRRSVAAMPRADLRPAGTCTIMQELLCRIHTARPVCAGITVACWDESTVLNNLRHTAFLEIRHRPHSNPANVVVASNQNCGGCILHHQVWARLGRFTLRFK